MELTRQEKQEILFSYMQKKKGISLKKAQEELALVNWDIKNLIQGKEVSLFGNEKDVKKDNKLENPKKVKKETKKKKEISENNKSSKKTQHQEKEISDDSDKEPIKLSLHKVKEDYNDFDWYLERCKQQKKKNSEVPLIEIGTGFHTMKEIVKATEGMMKHIDPEKEALTRFNRIYKTKYESWKQVSLEHKFHNEEDLVKYQNNILWYYWLKTNDPSKLSKKVYKVLKSHFLMHSLHVDQKEEDEEK